MADGESLAISVPAGETRVLKYFQERMPYGLFVPDVPPKGREQSRVSSPPRAEFGRRILIPTKGCRVLCWRNKTNPRSAA
jgi:hypothetical protein